jgi:hypothetical protein
MGKYIRESIKRTGWRKWLDDHRSPDGWGANEFDLLVKHDASITLLMRIWHKNRSTIEKYVAAREKDKV